jgi:hypothetical protein
MIDLSAAYLGLKLKSPLVVSSSPLTKSAANIQRLEEAGAAAVVLPSIFEEQLTLESDALERDLNRGGESFCGIAELLPGVRGLSPWAGCLSCPDRAGQERLQHSGPRQPERGDRAGVGAVCKGDRAGGRRRD